MIQSIIKERPETRKCLSHLTNKNLKNAVTPPWYSKQCFKKIRNSKQKGELRHLPRIVEPKESSVNLRCRFLTAKMPSTPLTPRRTDYLNWASRNLAQIQRQNNLYKLMIICLLILSVLQAWIISTCNLYDNASIGQAIFRSSLNMTILFLQIKWNPHAQLSKSIHHIV